MISSLMLEQAQRLALRAEAASRSARPELHDPAPSKSPKSDARRRRAQTPRHPRPRPRLLRRRGLPAHDPAIGSADDHRPSAFSRRSTIEAHAKLARGAAQPVRVRSSRGSDRDGLEAPFTLRKRLPKGIDRRLRTGVGFARDAHSDRRGAVQRGRLQED